jgi:hypothetical protein
MGRCALSLHGGPLALVPVVCRGAPCGRLVHIRVAPVNYDLRLRRLMCGKASPFRRTYVRRAFSAQDGRLSLPACAEKNKGSTLPGKPEAFRKAGRHSRSEEQGGLLIWTALPLVGAQKQLQGSFRENAHESGFEVAADEVAVWAA